MLFPAIIGLCLSQPRRITMLNNRKNFSAKILSAGIVSLLVGLGAGGAAIGAAMDNLNESQTSQTSEAVDVESDLEDQIDFSSGPVQCEIRTVEQNGALVLESIVHSLEPVNGIYRVKVASVGGSNRSSIQQGGYFSADEHQEASVGKMMLGNRGAVYDVSLSIEVDGETIGCEERIGTS